MKCAGKAGGRTTSPQCWVEENVPSSSGLGLGRKGLSGKCLPPKPGEVGLPLRHCWGESSLQRSRLLRLLFTERFQKCVGGAV